LESRRKYEIQHTRAEKDQKIRELSQQKQRELLLHKERLEGER